MTNGGSWAGGAWGKFAGHSATRARESDPRPAAARLAAGGSTFALHTPVRGACRGEVFGGRDQPAPGAADDGRGVQPLDVHSGCVGALAALDGAAAVCVSGDGVLAHAVSFQYPLPVLTGVRFRAAVVPPGGELIAGRQGLATGLAVSEGYPVTTRHGVTFAAHRRVPL